MGQSKVIRIRSQSCVEDTLSELLREKAMDLPQATVVVTECTEPLDQFSDLRDETGQRLCALVVVGVNERW